MNDTFLKACRGEKQSIPRYGLCARQADICRSIRQSEGRLIFSHSARPLNLQQRLRFSLLIFWALMPQYFF